LKHPASGKVKTLAGGSPQTTNNQMELTGAIEGLKAIDATKRRRVHLDDPAHPNNDRLIFSKGHARRVNHALI
jgi:transketolase N-terminal domain/subunit